MLLFYVIKVSFSVDIFDLQVTMEAIIYSYNYFKEAYIITNFVFIFDNYFGHCSLQKFFAAIVNWNEDCVM